MLAPYEKIYIMQQVQVLTQEMKEHPWVQGWMEKLSVIYIDDWRQVSSNIPVVCSSDLGKEYVRHWLNVKQPAIYIGRGYVGNHASKQILNWRASVNDWANIELQTIPYSRWYLLNLPRHCWKVKSVKNVLIAPSRLTTIRWSSEDSKGWYFSMKDKFPGAEIKVRYKHHGSRGARYATLFDDLDWADLVVSQSSAITCEAFWYGKKVISTEPCPTWACERSLLEDWQNPKEPINRDLWHEHIAWSQYSVNEWASGEAFDLIEKYLGNIKEYCSTYFYNFK